MKQAIKERLIILKFNLIYTFKNETAYWADNIGSLFSTTFYNIAYVSFIGVLFSNTKNIAGYDYNQMLFFYLIAELCAYLNGSLNLWNMQALIESVNKGELDLLLTKPISSLFYVSFRNIKIFSFVRDGIRNINK